MANLCEDEKKWEGHHVIVTTPDILIKLAEAINGIDLSELKVVVIDEADFFFVENEHFNQLGRLNQLVCKRLKLQIQWILFSATLPEEIVARVE